jgi:hypothetical protein
VGEGRLWERLRIYSGKYLFNKSKFYVLNMLTWLPIAAEPGKRIFVTVKPTIYVSNTSNTQQSPVTQALSADHHHKAKRSLRKKVVQRSKSDADKHQR